VLVAVVLTCIVVLLRSLREPAVAALQAMDQVRPVGHVSVAASLVAVPVVIVSLLLSANLPAWSLLGPAVGELFALWRINSLLTGVKRAE